MDWSTVVTNNQAISWPHTLSPNGVVATATSPTKIYLDKLITLLSTSVGQRPMLPTYGVDWSKSLFESDGDAEIAIKQAIADAVAIWLPEVEINDAAISYDSATGIEQVVLSVNLPGDVTANLPINSALLNYNGTITR